MPRRIHPIVPAVLGLFLLSAMPVKAADPEIDRLLQAPIGRDWVTNGGNLTNQRYSTLKQIDTSINLARKSNVSPGLLAELYESKARSCMDYGRNDEAKKSLEQAVRLQPQDPTTLNDLAWMLATSKDNRIRDGRRARALAMKACQLSSWKNAFSIDTLAAAAAATGDYAGAVKYQQQAISTLGMDDRKSELPGMMQRLQIYSSRQPYTSL